MPPAFGKGACAGARRARGARRRGTVMVFVLGMLALLAIIGLTLIARTHGEFKRVTLQTTASSADVARDGVVRRVREILRRDIWGDPPPVGQTALERPLADDAPADPLTNPNGVRENNEPYDAPGPQDRWLASNVPTFFCREDSAGNLLYCSDQVPTGNVNLPTEDDVLQWHRVSYLGTDVIDVLRDAATGQPAVDAFGVTIGNRFRWLSNSRAPAISHPPSLNNQTNYADGRRVLDPTNPLGLQFITVSELEDIPILQTPIPGWEGVPMIPGSTTNVTIAQARSIWESERAALQAELDAAYGAGTILPEFPYFDTNADGIVDLYDADGDGIPDSPISFPIETSGPDPDRPRRLYAAIRIVDHGGMLNVNTASAMFLPGGGLNFNESATGLQRRGRRATEFLLDDVAHRDDWFTSNAVGDLDGYRSNGRAPDPVLYDFDVVRRVLVGGLPDFSIRYNRYGPADESSLRHRNLLVPYDRVDDRRFAGDRRRIDRALPGSLLWSRKVVFDSTSHAFRYDLAVGDEARWSRLNADYQPAGTANPTYEGYADGLKAGWRGLLDEDQTLAVRRPMMTTVSLDVLPPPDITAGSVPDATITALPEDSPLDFRLRQLWDLGMNWPVLVADTSHLLTDALRPTVDTMVDALTVRADRIPPEWARVQPIDINMGSIAAPAAAKGDFLRYTAAAMYLALDAVPKYQVLPLIDQPAAPNASVNRLYLSWQFAVNLLDYRDSDNVPTILEVPTLPGRYVFGMEKQPFFTEAYAHLIAGDAPAGSGPGGQNLPPGATPDRWFFAVELFVPPGWNRLSTANLYLRAPGSTTGTGLIPLTAFRQVTTNTALTELNGGPADIASVGDADHGNYYVLAGSLDHIPSDVSNSAEFQARAYFNNAFEIATDGHGRVELVYSPTGKDSPGPGEPPNHILDLIAPQYSGGDLADHTPSGDGVFAHRLPAMSIGQERSFSLRRSTKGWRFTTCWHVYADAPGGGGGGGPAFGESLGKANAVLDVINRNVPESVWPTITAFNTVTGDPLFARPNGFGGVDLVSGLETGQPFEAFDSVADLSRLFLIGPVHLDATSPFPVIPDSPGTTLAGDLSATALLAEILDTSMASDLPPMTIDRVAAGRLDFSPGPNAARSPWSWRLFQMLTTQGHLFDGVDNDGDGLTDLNADPALGDPTEGYDVLYRLPGRINLNTAPATVLRSGPFMSLLPTAPEFVKRLPFSVDDAADYFLTNKTLFWDFASAIVAVREDRPVALRLPDVGGTPRVVARAERNSISAAPAATGRGAFSQVVELATLGENRIIDAFDPVNPANELFQVDRFTARRDTDLPLYFHKVRSDEPTLGELGDPWSPDFRFSRDNQSSDYIPILAPAEAVGDSLEAAGIRGRDVFLSRWTGVYTTRSDVFTAYIALIDEDGRIVQRSEITLDRSDCFREVPTPGGPRRMILPRILVRSDGSYADDTK